MFSTGIFVYINLWIRVTDTNFLYLYSGLSQPSFSWHSKWVATSLGWIVKMKWNVFTPLLDLLVKRAMTIQWSSGFDWNPCLECHISEKPIPWSFDWSRFNKLNTEKESIGHIRNTEQKLFSQQVKKKLNYTVLILELKKIS